MSWFASKEKKARMAAEMKAAEAAEKEEHEVAKVKWQKWKKDKEVRESQEEAAAEDARTKIDELAKKNNQEIENIFNENFKPLKDSIAVQFKEISNNIKKDLNEVIADSKSTLAALNIDLATITMNQSLNDVDTLLANLNPENLVSMLDKYEEHCKMILNKYLGNKGATVNVTKRVGEPPPANPYPVGSWGNPYESPDRDGFRGWQYRGGGSSKSSKKRKPIKKRRNTKRRM